MKTNQKILAISLVSMLVIAAIPLFNVAAQSLAMNSRQTEFIRGNCVTAKNTLNQLHASDALLRVNVGQTYESLLTKLMTKFNARISSNNYNNADFVAVTGNYGTMLDQFRQDYISYEEQLTHAINIDCSAKPVDFYDAVVLARTKRSQVHADVVKLNQYVNQYKTVVSQFEKNYQKTSSEHK